MSFWERIFDQQPLSHIPVNSRSGQGTWWFIVLHLSYYLSQEMISTKHPCMSISSEIS